MKASIEVSYYPLHDDYLKPIGDFIRNLNSYENIKVFSNGMSTQIFGEFKEMMQILTEEIEKAYDLPHSVFVLKVINADLNIYDNPTLFN